MVLVRNSKIILKPLAASRMSENDLAEDLRQESIESADDIKSARLARRKKTSVIKKVGPKRE